MTQAKMTGGAVQRYEDAFDHFLARRFDQAEAAFVACEKEYPDDYCIKSYLQASRDFLATPASPPIGTAASS